MKFAVAFLAVFAVFAAQAEIYKCPGVNKGFDRFQDYPCKDAPVDERAPPARGGTARPLVIRPQADPSGGSRYAPSAAEHNREYLNLRQQEQNQMRRDRDHAEAASNRGAWQQQQSAQTDAGRRAVQNCTHDQRADEMRSGRTRYTCDLQTGQKIDNGRGVIVIPR